MNTQCSRPFPLGATLDTNGCNFAIHAPGNDEISLALFDDNGNHQRIPLSEEYAGIRYTYVPNIRANQKYGYIVEVDGLAHYIADPYAKSLDAALDYKLPFDCEKSFQLAKCVVSNDDFDWQNVPKPNRARDEMILFETHVKGVSKLNPLVDEQDQGCYLGLVSEAMLKFYRQQNINTLQLLPIAACIYYLQFVSPH